jgi:ligand-binding sensor domain-containing protein/signal transduction histidine kinase
MGHRPQFRSSIVTGLSSSKQGGLWFSLEHSAFGFCDGKQVLSRGREEWGGVGQNVHAILETDDGTVWVAAESQSGILSKSNSYETLPIIGSYDITAICQGSQGRVWLGTTHHGLFYWQNGAINKHPDAALDQRIIRALVEDKQGKIWVGTELGLLCYDSQFNKMPLPYPWYETRALTLDRHGAVWVGTVGGGLVRYLDDVASLQFRHTDGLSDDFVNAITEDQEGSLWVGTRNGLSQLSNVKIPTFGKTEGLTANVNIAVSPSRGGGLWVATSSGAMLFNPVDSPENPIKYTITNGLRNTYVKGVLEAKNGDVYMVDGSMNVEVFSGSNVVASYPNHTWPTALTEDAKGVIVAVDGELYRVSTNSFVPYTFLNDETPQTGWVFNMITDHEGAIWTVGSEGIVRIKNGTFTSWTKQDGLADTKATCICEDSAGVIWAGLETGIARIKNAHVRNISRDNGLFDNIIYNIVPDDHGSLWVAASRGFFKVSLQSLNDFADGKTNHVESTDYDSLDAVKTFERNQQESSGCKTRDGRIWFPTAQGVAMIDPMNMAVNPMPPPVYVHTVFANGKELNPASNAVVCPGKGELEFHYAGVSYVAPQKVQHRYKLDGYDKDWVLAGTRHSAFYTNLKPGKYCFHVQACNADGIWNNTGASFSVELLPHFYDTTWFNMLLAAAGALLLFGIYGWRAKRLRWEQKKLRQAHVLLETKVRERTTELATSNTSLKSEIEERKRAELEVERVHQQLVDASRMAGQAEVASSVLHNVGNVLNSVNVSTTLLSERLQKMRLANFSKAMQLMREHSNDLGHFLTADQKGSQLPKYLDELATHLTTEQSEMLTELNGLAHNVEHIKEIVAMQQNYAKVSGAEEKVEISELVEGALKMNSVAYVRHSVKVVRQYDRVPTLVVDRHKVLQILINIFANAKYACDENRRPNKTVTVRIKPCGQDRIAVEIADNGIGISSENLTKVFSHGFTTRKNGHGFGLHGAALAAKEMGGTLTAHSEGIGKGALFILEMPLQPKDRKAPQPPREETATP